MKIYVVNKYLKESKYKQLKSEDPSSLDFKVLTLEELINILTYSKTDQALEYIYTSNYANKNYALSKLLLTNVCNLYDGLENIDEINDLIKLKQELISRNFIYKNNYKIRALQNSEVYIQSYLYTDKIRKLLDDNNIKSFILNEKRKQKDKDFINILIYDNYSIEINDAVNKIADLINKKISTDKILLVVNPGKEMEAINLLKNCNINGYFEDIDILNQNIVYKTICKLKEDFISGEEYINNIDPKDKISILIKNNMVSIYSKCISDFKDNNLRLDYFINEISKVHILTDALGILVTSSIEKANMFNHVFITYFDEKYPIKSTNNDYLLDTQKEKYSYLNPSYITSKIEKEELMDLFFKINDLHISRSNVDFTKDSIEKSDFEKYLIKTEDDDSTKNDKEENNSKNNHENEFFDIVNYKECSEKRYSKQNILNTYALLNQLFTQYGFTSSYYSYLFQNKDKFDYKKFIIDNENISLEDSSILNRKVISFSSLSTYATCPFKYLLERIFKLNSISDPTYVNIGTINHKILEEYTKKYKNDQSYLNDFVNEYKDKYYDVLKECEIDENNLTLAQKFYYQKSYDTLLEYLPDFDNFIKTFNFNSFKSEYKFANYIKQGYSKLEYTDPFLEDKKIEGTIDLICTSNASGNNKSFVVDFKTGEHRFNKLKCECGIDMQLAFYTYSLTKIDSIKDDLLLGFAYFQVPYKNFLYELERDTKISGQYFCKDMYIDNIDNNPTIYISNLTNSRTSCVFKDLNELKTFYTKVDETLVDLITRLESNKFNVTKTFVNKEDQCKFCNFKDCCYVNLSDDKQVVRIVNEDIDNENEE